MAISASRAAKVCGVTYPLSRVTRSGRIVRCCSTKTVAAEEDFWRVRPPKDSSGSERVDNAEGVRHACRRRVEPRRFQQVTLIGLLSHTLRKHPVGEDEVALDSRLRVNEISAIGRESQAGEEGIGETRDLHIVRGSKHGRANGD